jgi:hypothetical protein
VLVANDAVPRNEPVIPLVTVNDPVITALPENGNDEPPGAYDALKANDAVPCNDPVIPDVTDNDPDTMILFVPKLRADELPEPSVIFLGVEVIILLSDVIINPLYMFFNNCPTNDAMFYFCY